MPAVAEFFGGFGFPALQDLPFPANFHRSGESHERNGQDHAGKETDGPVPVQRSGFLGHTFENIWRAVAQSGSAPALGAVCRWFKSNQPDH